MVFKLHKREKPNDMESLFQLYGRKLYFTALRITGNDTDAQEAVQKSFINFYNRLETKGHATEIQNTEAYLTGCCVKVSIDIVRGRKRDAIFMKKLKEADYFTETEYNTEELQLEENKLVESIKEALAVMDEEYRIIISLRAIEGYSYSEIAEMTGLKEGSIRVKFLRGKEKLIKYLKGYSYG